MQEEVKKIKEHEDGYVKLARTTIEHYVREKVEIIPEVTKEMKRRAGVFVSIHEEGRLRGCIGTFMPVQDNIALEIHNAISACSEDPRFDPITEEELDNLIISVDILGEIEQVEDISTLDPHIYGIIVSHGSKRGLLLPDLEGVDTVTDQIQIACHKAGIHEGQTGFCHQRINKEGSIVLKDYGAITSLSLDPIEKKPLYHFYPETQILSVGSYGCNMKCPFCQNYTISQDRGSSIQVHTTPEKLVEVALDLKKEGNIGIAFTYNEPLISYEFIYDTFVLCKKHDLKTVIVSNGMIEEKYIKELSPLVDAWNIDLKGFREDIYKILSGDLETVWKSLL